MPEFPPEVVEAAAQAIAQSAKGRFGADFVSGPGAAVWRDYARGALHAAAQAAEEAGTCLCCSRPLREKEGSEFTQVFYLRAVFSSIADGIPFRGVADPREIARRTVERDWPPAEPKEGEAG